MIRAGLMLMAALALLLAAMGLKGQLIALPEPPAEAGPGAFDAHRAAGRLARVLGDERAHPVDSDANDAVRERLIAEMRAVGLDPRIEDSFTCNPFARSRTIACARVRNLVATIGPRDGDRHLLLSAHYDGTFAGPGAADAGIGVATLLEVAYQLRGRPVRRPITFLFNEGEEMGLLGARAFLDGSPLAGRVDALLNFEARGVRGPAVMFETSRPNAAAVALFARVARPFGNSLSVDLYRLIPNSTDVAVFEARPWTILNFAVIGNETRYHSAGDDMAALSRASLQHMGDQALRLTRSVAADGLPEASGERIYLDLLGRQLLVLPLLVGLSMLGLLLVGAGAVAWRRRALGRPLLACVAAVVGAPVVAFLVLSLTGLLREGDFWRGYPIVTHLAVYACAAAAGLAALRLIAGEAERERLRVAFWLLFLAAGALVSLIAPGGAVYFLLPPLAYGLGVLAGRRWRWGEIAGALLANLLLFLTLGAALDLFETLMMNGPHWMFAPIAAFLMLPWLIELQPLIARIPRLFAAGGAADLALLGWLATMLVPAYSEDRQQMFAIDYVLDEASGEARWSVNNDGASVDLPGDWRRGELPFSTRKRWLAEAPALDVRAPSLALLAEERVSEGRRLRLRLATNGAEAVTLIAPEEAPLVAAGVAGSVQPFGEGDGRHFFRCVGRSCDGAEIVLIARSAVDVTVVGTRTGLPAEGQELARRRPPLSRPQYGPDSTVAIGRARL